MSHPIKLIVGLGNPGREYETTRHNAGAWFVERLAASADQPLHFESKFKGCFSRVQSYDCHLFIPTTFMNLSGQAVAAISKFYKISPQNILIAHDDLDLPAGAIRLKFDGGHGGHNGLRDIMSHFNTQQFYRLRIGINHPGNSKQVVDYVLKPPSRADRNAIDDAIEEVMSVLPDIISGDTQKAMKALHTK